MPAGQNFPIKPLPFNDVLQAITWALERAEAGRNMPDLSRNPNSKLAVLKRCHDEISRNRRQIEYLVVENKVLKDLLLKKDEPCPTQPDSTTSPDRPSPPP
jgi:hypothetical protein